MKPKTVALILRPVSASLSTIAAMMIAQIGRVKDSAIASASGNMAMA